MMMLMAMGDELRWISLVSSGDPIIHMWISTCACFWSEAPPFPLVPTAICRELAQERVARQVPVRQRAVGGEQRKRRGPSEPRANAADVNPRKLGRRFYSDPPALADTDTTSRPASRASRRRTHRTNEQGLDSRGKIHTQK